MNATEAVEKFIARMEATGLSPEQQKAAVEAFFDVVDDATEASAEADRPSGWARQPHETEEAWRFRIDTLMPASEPPPPERGYVGTIDLSAMQWVDRDGSPCDPPPAPRLNPPGAQTLLELFVRADARRKAAAGAGSPRS